MTVTTDGRIVAAAGSDGQGRRDHPFARRQDPRQYPDPRSTPPTSSSAATISKTLYICAGKSLYRIKTTMTGYHLWPPLVPSTDRS